MKVVAFVPIKLKNERLPNKNILPLGGKPLCQHMLDTLLEVNGISEIYVFCSDETISKYLPDGVQFLRRDSSLDSFQTQHYQIVDSFISAIDADIYINAHVTNPFVRRQTIESGINSIISRNHDSACAVNEIREHLWYEGKPFNFELRNPPRTQDLVPLNAEVGLFMYRKEVFMKSGTRYGANPFFLILDKIEAIDINYNDDYRLAQAICSMHNKYMELSDNETES